MTYVNPLRDVRDRRLPRIAGPWPARRVVRLLVAAEEDLQTRFELVRVRRIDLHDGPADADEDAGFGRRLRQHVARDVGVRDRAADCDRKAAGDARDGDVDAVGRHRVAQYDGCRVFV